MLFDLAEIALRNILALFGFAPGAAEEGVDVETGAAERDSFAEINAARERDAEDDLEFSLGVAGFRTGSLYNELGRSDFPPLDSD